MEKLIKEIKALTPQQAFEIKGGGAMDTRQSVAFVGKFGRVYYW